MEHKLLVLGQDDLLELLQMLVDQRVVNVGLLGDEGWRDWQGLRETTEHGVETLNGEGETWRGLELKSLVNICSMDLRARRAWR